MQLINSYRRNMEPSEVLKYGLEKASDSSASIASFHQLVNLTNPIPTVKYKNPHRVKVYPPIWPPTTKTTVNIVRTLSKTTKNIVTATTIINNTTTEGINKGKDDMNIENTIVTEHSPTAKILESPIHRRSINGNERKLDKDTGSIILKIVDDEGQSRIEIKLSPNEFFDKEKSRMLRSSLKKDAKANIVIDGNDKDLNINELSENVEISILPNDTVVIANNVYNFGVETVNSTIKPYENQTDNNTNYTQYIDKETVILHIENKTDDIEQIIVTVENQTEPSTNEDIIVNKTEAVINTTQIPEVIEKIYLESAIEPLNTTTVTSKEIIGIENTVPLITTTEVFGLKVIFDNVTRSFTEPYDKYVLENKTSNT